MCPAYTQLVAKWSSPSIGDQRATGCACMYPTQSDVESTTFNTFKVDVIIKLVCAVSYQCWISSVYQWVRGGSICIRAVGDWRGPYLHILQFTLAHRTQLDFIQTGVKLSGGEIKPHFWKYSKSIAKRRNIYLVKMGRNPSGPVWMISRFCSQRICFFSS